MDSEMVKGRLKKLNKLMKKSGIDALVLTVAENVSFFTGFNGHDSWAIIKGTKVTLVTDSRYTEQAQKECLCCKIVQQDKGIAKATGEILNKLDSVKIVGVENRSSMQMFRTLKKHTKARVKASDSLAEKVRREKDSKEQLCISKAAKIAWKALDKALEQLRIGITESEWTGIVELEIRKLNSVISFDTIIAFGANGSLPHYQPGNRKLKKNDYILIDFGAKYKGYHSDLTRCFAVGKPSAFYRKAYDTVYRAQQEAVKNVRAGVKLSDLDSIARKVIADASLPVYGHGTGHGVGLEIHEAPMISKSSKDKLRAGDVVTIEPGIYMPGKLGIRIEDDVLVTETGCRVLSKDDKFGFSVPGLQTLIIT
ncbi:MAG: aminopeptidase P family protein [Sedimentisphaerales bacterium]|nr:aminopeptidase P family protein [Sedimentisphaerales bacterium]